jgi:nitroreductase
MVRRFDPDRPVDRGTVRKALAAALRAPTAGHTQGWDFVVLDTPERRQHFWAATADREPDAWLLGVSAAPTLIVCCSNPEAYLDRYAEPDKGWTDRDTDRWPIPYWDVDTGMAALLILLSAVDQGLGALFFGVPAGAHDDLRRGLGIPPSRRIVGVVALGHEARRVTSPSLRRARRTLDDAVHWGSFGESGSGSPGA